MRFPWIRCHLAFTARKAQHEHEGRNLPPMTTPPRSRRENLVMEALPAARIQHLPARARLPTEEVCGCCVAWPIGITIYLAAFYTNYLEQLG